MNSCTRTAQTLAFLLSFWSISYAQITIGPSLEVTGGNINASLGDSEFRTLDFNGDGYYDLLSYERFTGGVYKFRMKAGAPDGTFVSSPSLWSASNLSNYTLKGRIGDYNGDNFDDLLFSTPSASSNKGKIEITYGQAPTPTAISASFTNFAAQGGFGTSFDGGGDLNNDGFDDLVISAPNAQNAFNKGRVYCFYGNATGLDLMNYDSIVMGFGGIQVGKSVSHIGDFDGDGFGDIIMSVHSTVFESIDFMVYRGSADGLVTDAIYYMASGNASEGFGQAFGPAGDLNGDGNDDFFVSSPLKYSSVGPKGIITVFYGGQSPSETEIHPLNTASYDFGTNVDGVGDYDNDGFDDLAYTDTDKLYVFRGSSTGVNGTPYYQFTMVASNQVNLRYSKDMNGDGFGDFLLGSGTYDSPGSGGSNSGWIGVFKGRPNFSTEFTATTQSYCTPGNLYQFTNQSIGGPTVSWVWDFGDGTTSTEENPVHSYSNVGNYAVKFTATNALGHAQSMTKDSFAVIYAPLSAGTYTLGGAGAYFETMTDFNDKIQCGCLGDVAIKINDGNYSTQLRIIDIPDNGNTLTIESASAAKENVVLSGGAKISKLENVNFRNLSFDGKEGYGNLLIHRSKNINIEGCAIYAAKYINVNGFVAMHIDSSQQILVDKCQFDSYIQPNLQDGGFRFTAIYNSHDVSFNENYNVANTPIASVGNQLAFSALAKRSGNISFDKNQWSRTHFRMMEIDTFSFQNHDLTYSNVTVDTGSYVLIQKNIFNTVSGSPMSLEAITGINIQSNKISNCLRGVSLSTCQGVASGGYNLVANNALGGQLGGYEHGLALYGGKDLKLYHNSVLFDKKSTFSNFSNGVALAIFGTENVDVRNNAFKVDNTSGTNGMLHFHSNTNLTLNYNAYDGYNYLWDNVPGLPYSFETYQTNTDYDQSSFAAAINYLAIDDLHIDETSPALLNSVPALSEVTFDLDGNPRPTDFVDVGAYEFGGTTVTYDINLATIETEQLNVGSNQIKVKVINQRPTVLSTIDFSYKIDYKPEVTEQWTGVLQPYDTLIYTFSTPLVIPRGLLLKMVAKANLPASQSDVFMSNNTQSKEYPIGMAGTYKIGGTGFDIPDILKLQESIQKGGVVGDMTLLMAPGTYNSPLNLVNQSDFDVTYTSLDGNQSSAKLYIRKISGSKHIHFYNLTILPEDYYSYEEGGLLIDRSDDISFKKCAFLGNQDQSLYDAGIDIKPGAKYVAIDSCYFSGFDNAITLSGMGYFIPFDYVEGDFYFRDCSFENISTNGIRLIDEIGSVNITVDGCRFMSMQYPIRMDNAKNMSNGLNISVNASHFHDAEYSIFYSPASSYFACHPCEYTFTNNFFTKRGTVHIVNARGRFEFVNNSFNMTEDLCFRLNFSGDTQSSNGFLNMYNNNFVGGSPFYNEIVIVNNANYQGGNNNYYNLLGTGLIAYDGNIAFTTDEIPSKSGGHEYDAVSLLPDYLSETDLHIGENSLLRGKGNIYFSVPTDYDGELRDTLIATIGADDPVGTSIADYDFDGWLNEEEDTNRDGDLFNDDANYNGVPDFLDPQPFVYVAAKVFLQGPFDASSSLMHDSLRTTGFLPAEEPYTNEVLPDGSLKYPLVNAAVKLTPADALVADGPDAIVDWVFLELRDAADPTKTVGGRPAFLQRDGDIVDVEGIHPVPFYIEEGSYHVLVRHRNHLSVMSANPVPVTRNFINSSTFDFTSISATTYGNNAQKTVGSTKMMWGGDANQDGIVQFWGNGSDMNTVKSDVIQWPDNTNQNNNYMVRGYNRSDTNMDGKIITIGVGNDISKLMFYNALKYAGNTNYDIGFRILAQLP